MLFFVLGRIVDWLIGAYITVLLIRMVLDWVAVLAPRWRPGGVVLALIDVVYRLTDPPLRWLRRYIPPIPLGPVYFDISFMVLYFILIVLQILL